MLGNRESQHLHALLQLTLAPENAGEPVRHVSSVGAAERADFLKLADSHHVILRALRPVQQSARQNSNADLLAWTTAAIAAEEARIRHALKCLHSVCQELESAGCPVTVIKSLDHFPDLGNDLDLYTTANARRIVRVLVGKFDARMEPRSWGDRLANKWNFAIPGLKESVEIHVKRLGQTGEHIALAERFISRRTVKSIEGRKYFVPAAEERIVVATLQRMYRHFYFRVCDVINSAAIVESGELDFGELRRATQPSGIWPGVSTYLVVVSDYARKYRGHGLDLPQPVLQAARFGGEKINVRSRFLRVPLIPEGADLYTRQVTQTAISGDVPATFRLNLLPPLALAAVVAYKLTGSDKGVW